MLLLTVQDHASNQTTLTHDLLGRKTSMNDPDMGAWQYRYDAAGNLVKQRDARYQAICFYYDGHNRLVGKTYHAGISNLDTLTSAGLCRQPLRQHGERQPGRGPTHGHERSIGQQRLGL
ncbi:RHS repeat domain-containing protein [Candidatus Amarolinea dominans]|uniref:RHS repeat domain-containing protein n=1 Tax=Candidatus Amarolinea dominans TaxID=3140696 RepID=UPI0031368B70|nr:RHS repeat protein [Anaerolineae bacterium]